MVSVFQTCNMEDEDDPGVLLNAWLGELDSLQKVSGLRCVGAMKRHLGEMSNSSGVGSVTH